MHEGQRDKGLVRAVTSWGLAAGIINSVIGAGIFAVPAAVAASVGPYAPLAFLICAVAIAAAAICFAEGGSRIPTSGGVYGYVETAFGPMAAYITGNVLWFGDALGAGAVSFALADVAASLFPASWMAPVHAVVIVAVIGGIALVNVGGAARGARLSEGTIVLKLLPLAIFIVAGAGAIHRANFLHMAAPSSSAFGRAAILALFSFTGMEAPLAASGEVEHPAKAIPRALVMAMLPVVVLYISIQLVAQGILGGALAHSSAPLADAMSAIHPALRLIMLGGAAVSMFGYLASDIFGSPRILFAFAREGLLPRALGRVHPRTHAPHIAILCYSAVSIALAVSGTFAELAVLTTLASAVLYIFGSAAAWRLARRGVEQAGPPLNFRHLTAAMLTAVISMLILIALASRAEILGVLAVIVLSALIYLILSRLRKDSLSAVS